MEFISKVMLSLLYSIAPVYLFYRLTLKIIEYIANTKNQNKNLINNINKLKHDNDRKKEENKVDGI